MAGGEISDHAAPSLPAAVLPQEVEQELVVLMKKNLNGKENEDYLRGITNRYPELTVQIIERFFALSAMNAIIEELPPKQEE